MEYIIKRVSKVIKKDYGRFCFASKFSIDSQGALYFYSTNQMITKVNLDKTKEDFSLPGEINTLGDSSPCMAPLLLEDAVVHFRHINYQYFILKTNMDMEEEFRIDLGRAYVDNMFYYDNHIFYCINGIGDGIQDKIVKMTKEGEKIWEYDTVWGRVFSGSVFALSKGKLLAVTMEGFNYTVHVIDGNGVLIKKVDDILLHPQNEIMDIIVRKDNIGNVCICSGQQKCIENKRTYYYEICIIMLDPEGNEYYRSKGHLNIYQVPFLFVGGNYVFSRGSETGMIQKLNVKEDIEKNLLNDGKSYMRAGLSSEDKIYLCHGVTNESTLYCYSFSDELIWMFTVKAEIVSFDIRGKYLYYKTRTQVHICEIIEMEDQALPVKKRVPAKPKKEKEDGRLRMVSNSKNRVQKAKGLLEEVAEVKCDKEGFHSFGKYYIDGEGTLCLYSDSHILSKIGLDRTLTEYEIPDFAETNKIDYKYIPPIRLGDSFFHVRSDYSPSAKERYYITRTNLAMEQQAWIGLNDFSPN